MLRQAFPGLRVTAFDNLRRRGSELNLPRLRRHDVAFVHGDVRCADDVNAWGPFDLLIDCAADPSVQAGLDGSPLPVIENNLIGTVHCMEAARRRNAAMLFLSTSRVYPIDRINALPCREEEHRFVWTEAPGTSGFSEQGIAEDFSLDGPRSLYGATKLAAELLLREYAFSYRMPVLINRCGIIAGPWQMGKVDQGVVTLWVARHVFERPLRYIGFGGQGKQVRDVLHIDDLFSLLSAQLADLSKWDGRAYNVGGGPACGVSLAELTAICQRLSGRQVPITSDPATLPVDLRIYTTDTRRAMADFAWKPQKGVERIVADTLAWTREQEAELQSVLE
jgi:CDP-paratose 2-epimerase